MKNLNIKLDSINKVKTFVNTISSFDGDFDLASDRYVVDAKSIMGIFSLDLSSVLRLDVHDEKDYEKVSNDLKDFTV
ncbi:MAG: HPr family phosphocarrier protein [Lachnospirales bacterium]